MAATLLDWYGLLHEGIMSSLSKSLLKLELFLHVKLWSDQVGILHMPCQLIYVQNSELIALLKIDIKTYRMARRFWLLACKPCDMCPSPTWLTDYSDAISGSLSLQEQCW